MLTRLLAPRATTIARRGLVASHARAFSRAPSSSTPFIWTRTQSATPVAVPFKRWATSTTLASLTSDPAETEALKALEEGTKKLEEGDVEAARRLCELSVSRKRTASGLFNLGVTCYHSKDFDAAIKAWQDSIEIQPDSPDAHMNLASAYILSPVSRPDLALHHLKLAASLSPEDPEVAFNLGAIYEATGQLEEALIQYKRSKDFGVERAAVHIRNVSAKILGQKMAEVEKKGGDAGGAA
ncbi:hypothetical protein BOTBODRAFT_28573 [Botryobasidium botryosum FD-172 SS1]|uniref:Uncharacterized protein n=1 Tax=Botryobasidium botryosum (strain FD-172 SS1) TaxID=930990 RepID=A0A067MWJ6_BOTB1|nr:hypothetical protein BOTBODRAFT_28573 [Botryobasidium botryosum FD-172 SS1]